MTYRGEHPAKKVARLQLYGCAAKILKNVAPGWIVTLTGPGAHESGCLRHMMSGPVLMADIDSEAADAAIGSVPRGYSLCMDVADVLACTRAPVRFAHLDFMGTPRCGSSIESALRALRGRVPIGGVVALTCLRARDGGSGAVWKRFAPKGSLGAYYRELGKRDPKTERQLRRSLGTVAWMSWALGNMVDVYGHRRRKGRVHQHFWEPAQQRPGSYWGYVGQIDYQTTSPMSIYILQRTRGQARTPSPRAIVDAVGCSLGTKGAPESESLLKRICADVCRRGVPSAVVADLAQVRVERVRAWKAHYTRGNNFAGSHVFDPSVGGVQLKRLHKVRGQRRWGGKIIPVDVFSHEHQLSGLALDIAEACTGVRRNRDMPLPKGYTVTRMLGGTIQQMYIDGDRKLVRKQLWRKSTIDRINQSMRSLAPRLAGEVAK